MRELKEIFRLVEKSDFSEVEVSQGDWRVKIGRGTPTVQSSASSYVPSAAISPKLGENSESQLSSRPPEASKGSGAKEPKGQFVTSPFVGTFYRSPSPDTDPYVNVGQTVKKGQSLCIIEAMKLMNEIESDFDGRVAEIFPENGQPVEFGEKLFRIEPL